VSRERAVVAHHDLRPLLALTADGLEVPATAPSPSAAALARLDPRVRRVPFAVDLAEPFQRDLLAALFVGDGRTLRFRYYETDDLARVVFGHVALQMVLRGHDGQLMAASRISDTPACVLTFHVRQPQLVQLLALLADEARRAVVLGLGSGRPHRLPEPGVACGVVARTVPPDGTGIASFVVEAFVPPAGPEMTARF
jgi:hypothetical protein